MRAAIRLDRRAPGLAIAALAALSCLVAAAAAVAAPPPPADLIVEGGQDRWRPSRLFRILWTNPAVTPPVTAVHYLVRDPGGAVVLGPTRLGWAASDVDGLQVPARPGAYVAEVWLEDANGQQSGRANALLRFDDERPGETAPLREPGWVGRAGFPLPVRLGHPERVPLSGLRGYAVSVSATTDRVPCVSPDRCSEAETDLGGGIDDDTPVIYALPEGISYLRAVAVSGSGMASVPSAPLALAVDLTYPTTTLAGAPGGWTNRPVELTASAVDAGSGMAAEPGAGPPFTAIAVDGAAPATAAGPSATARVAEEGVHRVAYYARDLAGNVDDGSSANGVANPPPRTALVRIDRTPPDVSFAGAQDSATPELMRVRVRDALSGPSPAGGWIGVRRRGSGDPFAALRALPAPAGELRARWDSEAFPDGEYEFRAVGFDRAGNRAATASRADGRPMTLSNPLKQRTALSIGFATGVGPRRAVPFGRDALLRGRLLAGDRPLAGEAVQVVERFAGSDAGARLTTVTTAADGGFSIRLPAGPSREVDAAFAGSETLSRAASETLRLAVRSELRLTASRRVAEVGGAPLVFAGRVSAAPGTIPPEGKMVELQFRLPGLPWTAFRTIRTDRRGRFRYRYRFSDDDSRGARFLFRAYAPAQGGWPYEPAGSKPVAVRGR